MQIEQTLIILKPGCLQRGIAGEIISRFEKKGLKITAMKLALINRDKAAFHYEEHKDKPFFTGLVDYITSSPVVLMVIEGENAVSIARKMAGATNVDDAVPGTIRGDYVSHTPKNIVHTSDGKESAEREIKNFFNDSEIINYNRDIDKWI